MAQRQHGLPAIETDCLAEQQSGDHPGEQHQMALIQKRAVLTQEADQLSMETGVGKHWMLVWCENPNVSWFPAHPIT
jgi:hypothetical protein